MENRIACLGHLPWMNPISPLVEEEEENECGAKRPGQHVSLPLFPSHTPTPDL